MKSTIAQIWKLMYNEEVASWKAYQLCCTTMCGCQTGVINGTMWLWYVVFTAQWAWQMPMSDLGSEVTRLDVTHMSYRRLGNVLRHFSSWDILRRLKTSQDVSQDVSDTFTCLMSRHFETLKMSWGKSKTSKTSQDISLHCLCLRFV